MATFGRGGVGSFNIVAEYQYENIVIPQIIYLDNTTAVAFGDNGPRKKSFFERLTVLVVLIMLLVTVGALIFQAVAAVL